MSFNFRLIRAYGVTLQILAKYFFLFFLKKFLSEEHTNILMARAHTKTAQKIISNILKLKGLYIKIGQTLSAMTNFLPAELTAGLEQLQDAVPPHPYSAVEARFKIDFGKTPKNMFASFDEQPIASASLAQVHSALLADGTRVAVKFQYPDIDTIVKKDLKTIRNIFGLLNLIFPNYGFKNIYNECSEIILQEIDFQTEAKNLEKVRENFKDDPRYVFPKVYWDYCSQRVLTAQFIEGIKITHTDSLIKAGVNPHEVAVNLIHAYCKQIFSDGVYHADPHPGNLIVIPTKIPSPLRGEGQGEGDLGFQIAFLDFGATAFLTPSIKEGMTLFVEGLIKRDTRILSNAMKQMGFIAKTGNEEAFDKVVDYFYGKIRGVKIEDFRDIKITNFQNLGDLFELKRMDISLRELTTTFHVPKDWILLERTLILAMGLVTHLDPQLNPMDTVLPYVEEFVLGKDKKMTDVLMMATKELVTSYINLPTQIAKVLKKIEQGQITITDKSRVDQTRTLYRAFHQGLYALFLLFSMTASYVCRDNLWSLRMKWSAIFFGVVLTISFMKNRK